MTLFKLLRRISGSNVMPGIVSVCVIVLYGMMTGLASSTCRAVIMMTVVVAAKIKGIYLSIGKAYCRMCEACSPEQLPSEAASEPIASLLTSLRERKQQLLDKQQTIRVIQQVMICPKCGASCSAEGSFCTNCGASLQEAKAGVFSCPACGSKLKPGAAFCTQCGKPVR